MGLLEELGYTTTSNNALQRTLQGAAANGRIGQVLQKTLHPLDKVVYTTTGGRTTAASLLAGVPVIMLRTIGAKTRRVRTSPLIGIPMGEDLAIIGSNFGTMATPGWVYNLEANPAAVVLYRKQRAAVTARLADDLETDRAFAVAAAVYAAFPVYRSRADHRKIRVFALEAAT